VSNWGGLGTERERDVLEFLGKDGVDEAGAEGDGEVAGGDFCFEEGGGPGCG